MTGYCKGICDRMPSFQRYVDGFKYCATCQKFLQVGELIPGKVLQCPCCHKQVRMRGRTWGKRTTKQRVYI